ncbi:MAG: hypothetical protein ACOH1U_01135 [Rhodoglobus sp.]
MRPLWKVGLILVPIVAALWLLARVVVELVPDPWGATAQRISDAIVGWPFSYLPASDPWWWIALSVSFLLVSVYVILRWQEGKRARNRQFDGKTGLGLTARPARVSVAGSLLFMNAIIEPQSIFSRITESVQPYTRSLKVRTTLSVRLGRGMLRRDVVIPLIMSARGRLENSLSFTDPSGMRVSSLNRTQTNAHIYGVIRSLISSAGPAAWLAFRAPGDEGKSLDQRVGEYISQASAANNEPVTQNSTNELVERILALPSTRDARLFGVARFINQIRRDYPICVQVNSRDFRSEDVRITVERRVIPQVVGKRKEEPGSGSLDSPAQNGGIGRTLMWFERVAASILDASRRFAGVTSSVLTYDLENAARAESYHLEVRGPEGYYAARQRMVDAVGLPISPLTTAAESVEHSPLQGQRHTHLYLRRARAADIAAFQAVFNERTPGSMAVALAAVVATLAIATIIAVTQVRDSYKFCIDAFPDLLDGCLGGRAASVVDNGSLIQILLTFPIALIAVSFSRSSSVWGGVLVARVVNVFVILLALAALALSTFASSFTAAGLSVAWIVVLGLLSLISVGTGASLVQRTIVHISYIRST